MLGRDAAEHVDAVDHGRFVDHRTGDDEAPAAAPLTERPETLHEIEDALSGIDAAQVHAEGFVPEAERTPGSVGVDRAVDLDGVPEDGLRRRCGRRKAFEDELLLGSAAVEQCIGGGEQLIEDREPKWRFRVGCRLEQGRHLGQVQTADRRLVEVRDQRKHTIIDSGNRLEEIGTVGPLPVDPVVGIVERDRRRGEELRAPGVEPGVAGPSNPKNELPRLPPRSSCRAHHGPPT